MGRHNISFALLKAVLLAFSSQDYFAECATIVTSASSSFFLGHPATLTCADNASATPATPTNHEELLVAWFKNGVRMKNTTRKLKFKPLAKNDLAVYSCTFESKLLPGVNSEMSTDPPPLLRALNLMDKERNKEHGNRVIPHPKSALGVCKYSRFE
ncbi:uncharacterized protein LOC101859973 [Aplysia californica]|uniref:Uncharacterized protein LOC101859973 n=1 Tax=Aplysia californica TaxID=6500 RepID=A0ABM0K518_APLCA|nr:uncharacterized protein LOC101859973 [Aplysia californica]